MSHSTTVLPRIALCLTAVLLVGCTSNDPGGAHDDHDAHWSYSGATGPEHWGDLDPDYALAKTGRQQSPIDIDQDSVAPGNLEDLEFQYLDEEATFVNNGHSLQHDEGPGSWLVFKDQRYRLLQFHFHTPSEHTVEGQHAPMEAHLVHKNDDSELLVVGVFIDAGNENPAMTISADQLPDDPGSASKASGTLNPARFISQAGGYYTYSGSLTTPPCTEDVTWIVMRDHVQVPPALLEEFHEIMGDNNRPVQPLCDRTIIGK